MKLRMSIERYWVSPVCNGVEPLHETFRLKARKSLRKVLSAVRTGWGTAIAYLPQSVCHTRMTSLLDVIEVRH